MASITTLAPTGVLGYGFNKDSFERGMSFNPDVIATDAGSTDPGPYYLGSGMPRCPRVSYERELNTLIGTALERKIPFIVGTAGGTGSDTAVAWTTEIVRELAKKNGWHFKMAVISGQIPNQTVLKALREGRISDFEAGSMPTEEEIASSMIVAQMGHEPLVRALEQGAQVIIAGRACDDAVLASMAIHKGFDPGLAIHMGKILECGAFCSEPFAMDTMVGILDETGFALEPGSLERKCTVASVAGHSLYERVDPFIQHGPGHVVDMTGSQFEQLSDRRVRVTGTKFTETSPYKVKLEGVRAVGCRTISIAGIRCPTLIASLDNVLRDLRAYVENYFRDVPFKLSFTVYGRDGVMRELEPKRHQVPHEVALMVEAVADKQELAHAICYTTIGKLLHFSYPGVKNNAGNLAFPFSPSVFDVGEAYEFSVYHLMEVKDPCEHFPMTMETL